MKKFEINGNLVDEPALEYGMFHKEVCRIREFYVLHFGEKLMSSIGLYVDNATAGSGHAPIITPVLGSYLVMKLFIEQDNGSSRVAFQAAHEFMHYVFFAKKGINKPFADDEEEVICTAASLIAIKTYYPYELGAYRASVFRSGKDCYIKGVALVESIQYDFEKLKEMI